MEITKLEICFTVVLVGFNCAFNTTRSHIGKVLLRNYVDQVDLVACLWWTVFTVNQYTKTMLAPFLSSGEMFLYARTF